MTMTVDQQIQRELVPGERLLWSGRPRGGLRLDPGWSFVVMFLLIWSSLALLDARANFRFAEGDLVFEVVDPALAALTGFSMVVSLMVIQVRSQRRTVYGLTDRRAFIAGGLFEQKVESLPLQAMTNTIVVLSERGDRHGTIRFVVRSWWCGDGECTRAFSRIDDVRHVHSLIQDAKSHQRVPWP